MNVILICPEHRADAGIYQRMRPLALMPVLGRTLLDHALAHLADRGAKEVLVLASDRPEQIRSAVKAGAVWGLKINVMPTSSEPSKEDALQFYGADFSAAGVPSVIVLDAIPGAASRPLWSPPSECPDFLSWIAEAAMAGQLTMREVSPGVWISTKAKVSRDAVITGPVWIGPRASITAGARVGPDAVIEAGAFVDSGACISGSWLGPDTYAGSGVHLRDSIAWGNGLMAWRSGSFLEVRDDFLINDIRLPQVWQGDSSWMERLFAFVLLLVSFPFVMLPVVAQRLRGRAAFVHRRVILPPPSRVSGFSHTHALQSLAGVSGMAARWPELWLVVTGKMRLVGNRPLSPLDATSLRGPEGENWMKFPAGIFSLADAEGQNGDCPRQANAYAAWFTARPTLRLKFAILFRCLARLFRHSMIHPSSPQTLIKKIA